MQAISLYSGAGGLDLGFEQAGIEIIMANDSWSVATDTYLINRQDAKMLAGTISTHVHDIMNVGRKNDVDMVFGGPPCQDFSSAGWRTGEGERANQTKNFVDLALKILPEWIVMENVNTIMSIGRRHVEMTIAQIKKAGYGITTQVLDAVDFGVPQFRKRFFLIARMKGNDDDQEIKSLINNEKRKRKTVREYNPSLDTKYYYRHPWSFERRAIFSVDEPSPTIRGVNRPIPPNYKIHHNDATSDLKQVRPLTTDERAILQTFPKEYRFVGNKTQREQQIGNSVPPMMAQAVANAIREY